MDLRRVSADPFRQTIIVTETAKQAHFAVKKSSFYSFCKCVSQNAFVPLNKRICSVDINIAKKKSIISGRVVAAVPGFTSV
jgi:hypothetical protein